MDDELMGLLKTTIDRFNEKARTDEKLKSQLDGIERLVVMEFHDTDPVNFHLCNMCIGEISDGLIEPFDIKVITDQDTLKSILKNEVSPMKAYATRKIKFKASLTDLLMLKNLFSD